MPERDFWKTMNPRRLIALLEGWHRPQRAPQRPQEGRSLSEYLMTGGK